MFFNNNLKKKEYITTAIVYPNARIHVGWAWECLGADWLARCLRAFGHPTFLSTGIDEHSINVQKAAEAKGLLPQIYCDQMAKEIQKTLDLLRVSYDRLIRTSDFDHQWVVKSLVQKAFENGDIYKAKYEGHYCESCEAYYTEKDLEGGLCRSHKKPPKWVFEENYFFRLSKYQGRLLSLFQENPEFLQPMHRQSEILNFIQAGLNDFSISRSSFTWGISLPFDPKHVVYVWFDALLNYLTAAGYALHLKESQTPENSLFNACWPARMHLIGKDISRFHCVYWPAMLMALDLPLPKKVFVHGFIQLKGEKMSKSSGNMVTPDEVVSVTGVDAFRYYLLAENQLSQDGNFSWESLILKSNADLSNDFGNLVNRSISMTRKYFLGESLVKTEKFSHSSAIRESFGKLPKELEATLESVDSSAYASLCNGRSRILNLYIDQTKPWVIAKQGTSLALEELREVLFHLLEGIRWLATAWMPILPVGMPEVFKQLGVPIPLEQDSLKTLQWGMFSFAPLEPMPIYPRLEERS